MDKSFLKKLGLKKYNHGTSTGLESSTSGKYIKSFSPVDGTYIGSVSKTSREEYEAVVQKAQEAFLAWREMPAPKRGELVRQYGDALRQHKDALGRLVIQPEYQKVVWSNGGK